MFAYFFSFFSSLHGGKTTSPSTCLFCLWEKKWCFSVLSSRWVIFPRLFDCLLSCRAEGGGGSGGRAIFLTFPILWISWGWHASKSLSEVNRGWGPRSKYKVVGKLKGFTSSPWVNSSVHSGSAHCVGTWICNIIPIFWTTKTTVKLRWFFQMVSCWEWSLNFVHWNESLLFSTKNNNTGIFAHFWMQKLLSALIYFSYMFLSILKT